MFYHDKKITSDAQLHKLIKTLCNTHDNDLKNELLKIIESGRVTRSVKFLCNLILQSLKNDSSIFPKKIIDLDHHQVLYNRESPKLNSCWNNDWYKTSWFSIITESWHFHPYQKSDNIQLYFPMISEKTIKAIMNNHPFIIFSAPGTSRLINKFGFKTFNQPLLGLPENFDEEVIPVTERLYVFIEALKKFSAKSHGEKVNIWNSIKPDIVYNTQILRKTDWIKVQHDLILEYGGC